MDFSKVTAYLDSLEAHYGIPGLDCRIMMDRQLIYSHRAGHRDYAKSLPMEGNELFDVYSATKVITMTAAMQLVEKGIIRLDDPVTKYLPMFRETRVADNYQYMPYISPMPDVDAPGHKPENPILLCDLMSMTAGLSYDLDNAMIRGMAARTNGDTMTMMEGIARLPLLYEPGTRYCYSLGHDVIAAVVEAASGERFADYLQHHIFDPLQLEDMTLHPGEAEKKRMAAQWRTEEVSERVVPADTGNSYRLTDNYDSGGAGLCCSLDNYLRFAEALSCGGVGWNGAQILSPESIRIMTTPRLNKRQQADYGKGSLGYGYGLGVRTLIYPQRSKSPEGEFGWDGAAGAFCLMDPKNRIALVYMQQVLFMGRVYSEVHPKLRDLVYEAIFEL